MAWLTSKFSELHDVLRNIQEAGDRRKAQEWSDEYKAFNGGVEQMLSQKSGWTKSPSVKLGYGARQRQLMLHVLPAIQKYMAPFQKGTVFDVLDVNCGYGHGTELLASLYLTSELGYRMRTVGCDGHARFHNYVGTLHSTFKLDPRAVAQIDRTFDIVVTIFGLPRSADHRSFCDLMCSRARGRVFVVAPFSEQADAGVDAAGHDASVTPGTLEELGAENIELLESPAWGAFEVPRLRVARFELPGRA